MAKKKTNEEMFNDLVEGIEKDLGSGAVRVGFTGGIVKCKAISTSCLSLDAALGVGGVPIGRIIEIFGPESSGKTTLSLHVAAEAQKNFKDKKVAFIDVEHAIDPFYARNIGVDMDNLLFSQPNSAEEALNLVDRLVRSGLFSVIITDSVAALTPQCELDGEIGDHNVGAQARLMGQAMRKFKSIANEYSTALIFINQIRDNIGGMPGMKTTTTPGGRALKFHASVRIEIKRIGSEFEGAAQSKNRKAIANKTVAKIIKNKVAPPFLDASFLIYFGEGISREADLLNLAVKYKIIKKAGSWYEYGGENFANGLREAVLYLKENKKLADDIDSKIRPIVLDIAGSEDIKETEQEE